jgi:nitroreductase
MDPRLSFIFSRRSIRKFTGEPIGDDDVKSLLEAGAAAPSANDTKCWRFVAVTDPDMRKTLADIHPHGKMQAEAGCSIAVCADPTSSPGYWEQDCSAATENILLAANALGLGAVWLGVHPKLDRKTQLAKALGIPAGIELFCLIAIGHPAEEKEARTQLSAEMDHRDKW